MLCKLLLLLVVAAVVSATCVNDCNAHGNCQQSECVCNDGWGGDDCSIWDKPIASGETKSGHLATFQWKYYHVDLPHGANGLHIEVFQTSDFGDIDVFVSRATYPDTQRFMYQDTSTGTHLTLQIEDLAAGVWYIGLYGYWSADYDITVEVQEACTVDCGPHGQCVGSSCSCSVPYYGDDCSIYNLPVESGEVYQDEVVTGEWKYYHLDLQEDQVLEVILQQTSDSYDLDMYVAIDRLPMARSFDYMNATVSQVTDMVIGDGRAGMYGIGVFGYRGGAYTIKAVVSDPVEEPEDTPGVCSGNGEYVDHVCSCEAGFEGAACQRYPEMELDVVYSGYVATAAWAFWELHYFAQAPIRVTVQQTGEGDCDLYLRQGQDPTRIRYQASDVTLETSFSLVIDMPGDDTWHLGVYGWNGCEYTITAELIEECMCTDGSHGHCQEGSNQCLCEIGYAGDYCDIETKAIASGQVLAQQTVEAHSWTYYHFTSDGSGVSITMKETTTSGDLFLIASLSGYPSGENFDYYDITDSDFHEVHILWENEERVTRTYFIAVVVSSASVATEPLEFSITAFGTPF